VLGRKQAPLELPGLDIVPPALAAWAQAVDVSQLSDHTADQIAHYLRKYRRMSWYARDELSTRLVLAISSQVSPPPPANTQPLDIMGTVLRLRQDREQATP